MSLHSPKEMSLHASSLRGTLSLQTTLSNPLSYEYYLRISRSICFLTVSYFPRAQRTCESIIPPIYSRNALDKACQLKECTPRRFPMMKDQTTKIHHSLLLPIEFTNSMSLMPKFVKLLMSMMPSFLSSIGLPLRSAKNVLSYCSSFHQRLFRIQVGY